MICPVEGMVARAGVGSVAESMKIKISTLHCFHKNESVLIRYVTHLLYTTYLVIVHCHALHDALPYWATYTNFRCPLFSFARVSPRFCTACRTSFVQHHQLPITLHGIIPKLLLSPIHITRSNSVHSSCSHEDSSLLCHLALFQAFINRSILMQPPTSGWLSTSQLDRNTRMALISMTCPQLVA
jgi:hypothetical protein